MYGAQGQVEMENWKLGEEVEKVDNWKLGPWVLRTNGQSVLRYTVSQYSGGRSAWLGTPSQPHIWVRAGTAPLVPPSEAPLPYLKSALCCCCFKD